MVKRSILVFAISVLTACNALPVKNQITPVNGLSVTYEMKGQADIRMLKFSNYERTQRGKDYIRNWGIKTTATPTSLVVTKFIDNGPAHSINEYQVKHSSSGSKITLTPIQNEVHQDGLLMPLPIPSFGSQGILGFLSSTQHTFSFEVDSKFPSESINANFKRLLTQRPSNSFSSSEKIYENTYFIKVDGAEAKIEVKTYPYRNGSKCTISAVYLTLPNPQNTIVLADIEANIKNKVEEIVNS